VQQREPPPRCSREFGISFEIKTRLPCKGLSRLVFIVPLKGPEQAKKAPRRASLNSIGAFGNVHFCDVQQIVFLVGPSRFFLNFGLSFYKSG
jgi:hypothetical protein